MMQISSLLSMKQANTIWPGKSPVYGGKVVAGRGIGVGVVEIGNGFVVGEVVNGSGELVAGIRVISGARAVKDARYSSEKGLRGFFWHPPIRRNAITRIENLIKRLENIC